MTEIRTVKPKGKKADAAMSATSFLLGSAFLASPVIYATSHHQKFPPYVDPFAAVLVGVLLMANGILSLRRASAA